MTREQDDLISRALEFELEDDDDELLPDVGAITAFGLSALGFLLLFWMLH